MDSITDQFRVIAYDARGYGRSTLPLSAAYSNALDLRNLLRFLGAAPATIVGCSLGAGIALDLAIEHPESVAALVLVNAPLNGHVPSPDPYARDWSAALAAARSGGPTQSLAESFHRNFVDGQGAAPESVHAQVGAILAGHTYPHFARTAPAPLTRSHLASLPSITAPTLVVLGERDIPTVHEFAHELVTRLPHA